MVPRAADVRNALTLESICNGGSVTIDMVEKACDVMKHTPRYYSKVRLFNNFIKVMLGSDDSKRLLDAFVSADGVGQSVRHMVSYCQYLGNAHDFVTSTSMLLTERPALGHAFVEQGIVPLLHKLVRNRVLVFSGADASQPDLTLSLLEAFIVCTRALSFIFYVFVFDMISPLLSVLRSPGTGHGVAMIGAVTPGT